MPQSMMKRIRPQHAELVPPMGAKQIGVTPEGKAVYRLERRRSRSVPDIDPATNKQRQQLHHVTGQPVGVPQRKREIYLHVEEFYLESDGQNNVLQVPYRAPTAAERAAEERAAKIAAMGGGLLGEALVDANMTPAEVLEVLRRARTPQAATADAATPDVPDEGPFPRVAPGIGRWFLSDGSRFQGNRVDATEAEAALARMAETPEL